IAGAVVLAGGEDLDAESRTDEKGKAVVGPLAPGFATIEVRADGFALEQHSLYLRYKGETELFLLAPGGVVQGVVRDAAGQPLAGTRLRAISIDWLSRECGRAVSDVDGRYRLSYVLRDTAIEVAPSHRNFDGRPQRVVVTESLQDLDFELSPRFIQPALQGAVVDPQGRPIVGALLGGEATTGSDGRFHAAGRLRGRGSILVEADGFVPRIFEQDVDGGGDGITIVLQPGHRIDGRTVDEAGKPLSDVEVRVASLEALPRSIPMRIVSTDDDGRFEFDTLPADCVFSFSKPGFPRLHHQQLTHDGASPVTVVMQPSGVFLGQVVDAVTGRPVGDFHVRCQRDAAGMGISVALMDPGIGFRTADGTFEIHDDGLAIGMPLLVIVDAEGYERLVVENVTARRRDEAESVSFRVKPQDPAKLVTYAGRLLDAAGAPVAGAEVRLIATAWPAPGRRGVLNPTWATIRMGRRLASDASVVRFGVATTDRQGRFEFARIPGSAKVELAWWRPGVAPARRRELELLSEDERGALEIRVDAAARIVGPIDRHAFPEARSIEVASDSPHRENHWQQLSIDQETFEFDDVAPGTYNVILLGAVEQAPVPQPLRGPAGFGGRNPANSKFPKRLAEVKVKLAAGEVRRVEFGKEE
ncbi:MAG TPA: carboxypeptidase-like regulatory domain-containing protein, partial [Pirellulales bacterium]|nr:carboxypeptidase-like regulatory domain-containing protein [Pirellulales bacterium]